MSETKDKEANIRILIGSSHGELIVDETGKVIECHTDGECCAPDKCWITYIASVDLREHEQTYKRKFPTYDILDLSGTYHNGNTFEYERDYREKHFPQYIVVVNKMALRVVLEACWEMQERDDFPENVTLELSTLYANLCNGDCEKHYGHFFDCEDCGKTFCAAQLGLNNSYCKACSLKRQPKPEPEFAPDTIGGVPFTKEQAEAFVKMFPDTEIMCKEYGDDKDWVGMTADDLNQDGKFDDEYQTFELLLKESE